MKRLFSASTSRSHHNSVRLACVRHAASVHPEPGSNSQFIIIRSGQIHCWLCPLIYFFTHMCPAKDTYKAVFCSELFSQSFDCFWNFSGLHYCLFFKVHCSDFLCFQVLSVLALAQPQRSLLYHLRFALSRTFLNLSCPFFAGKSYYSKAYVQLQELFSFFLDKKRIVISQDSLPSHKL